LHVRHEHAARIARWRHVTASDSLHGCGHLHGEHLYHRVERVQEIRNHSELGGITVVRLDTEELASPSQVFPYCRYYFNFVPAEAKDPAERARSSRARRLATAFGGGRTHVENAFQPMSGGGGAHSLLNLDVPTQLSNLGYNWNYDASSPKDPQFKYTLPGGIGFARLYKPYLRAHVSLTVNFTSHMKTVSQPPHVKIVAELKGNGEFNLQIATAANFNKEKSAGVLQNVLSLIKLPGNSTHSNGSASVSPLKFYFGPVPLTITPGFSCELKAYHIGLLKGSLKVGLASNIKMQGLMNFDSDTGLLTNVSGHADHINFTAPTWMLFTQHFELGVMLQPTFYIKGGFGDMKNMEMGFSVRPYINVSILQENAAQLGGDTSPTEELAIFPWRIVGLPAGGNYAVAVRANDQNKTTSLKYSTGVVEFNDDVGDFGFGTISQTTLLTVPIEVSILEAGQESPVAVGHAVCSSVVGGICKPSPVTAQMQVNGRAVYVHLTVVWSQNALGILMSKINSVALRFPTVSLSQALTQQLAGQQAMDFLELRVTRNGRTYSVPIERKANSSGLKSRVIYDLGPCFLDSWKSTNEAQGTTQGHVRPRLELLAKGSVVGTGTMPPVSWDNPVTLSAHSQLASNIRSNLKTIPVVVPLYPPSGGTAIVGSGEIEINVLPAQLAAFWVYPYQAETFVVGRRYTFHWTLVNGKAGKAVNFTLTAMAVGQDGSLTPTTWQVSVLAGCSLNASVPVKRYDGGVPSCIFSYKLAIPSSLADKQIVMVASWLGASLSSPHWMVSTPVRFTSGRRLNSGSWGIQSKGAVNHTGYGPKVKAKLQKLASHCSAQPLKYRVNAGMNFVEYAKNVVLPMKGVMPDWKSKPKPLLKRFGQGKDGGQLKDILPKILCSGGICEGMMPGCDRTKNGSNPLLIKQVNVQLSRFFRWKKHLGPKMRHAIAYGLALAPSAISMQQGSGRRLRAEAAGEPARRDAAGPEEEGRFLVEEDDSGDEELAGAEFDAFAFRIGEPMDYELTQALLDQLLSRGAFRGVSDGREASRGPVEITGLRLAELPGAGPAAPQVLYEAPGGLSSAGRRRGSLSVLQRHRCLAAATLVACLALLAASLVMARAAVRRRGYTLVGPPNVAGDARWFA